MKEKLAVILADWDGHDFADLPNGNGGVEPSKVGYRIEAGEILKMLCVDIKRCVSIQEIQELLLS